MLTNKSALKEMLLEIALGGDPTAGRDGRDDKEQKREKEKSTMPVSPSTHSSVQLSSDSPPIYDPEFLPANKLELSKSLYSIGELINDASAGEFYQLVKKAYEDFTGEEIG